MCNGEAQSLEDRLMMPSSNMWLNSRRAIWSLSRAKASGPPGDCGPSGGDVVSYAMFDELSHVSRLGYSWELG